MSESERLEKPPEKQYKRFSDIVEDGPLDGDKLDISDILNREILIRNYRTKKSNFQDKKDQPENYLTLQFSFPNEEKRHIVFTGSQVILDQVQRVNRSDYPIWATIRKIGKYFTLT